MDNYTDNTSSAAQLKKINNKYPGPAASGFLFSLATILLTYGGTSLPFKNNYLRSGMGELLFILLPVLIFLLAGRYNIKDTLKLNKTKPINYLIIVFLMMFGIPVVGVINAIALGIIRLIFGKNLPIPQIVIGDVPTLFIAILVIGGSAALCEETLFRGLISKGYERFGVWPQLMITSTLFGILHRDIQKAVSTILLGALIGFIVYRTNSIYSGMTAHFTNNTIAVILTFIAEKVTGGLNKMGFETVTNFDLANFPRNALIVALVFYSIMFLGFLSAFIALFFAFYKSTEKDIRAAAVIKPFDEYTLQPDLKIKTGMKRFSLPGLICVAPGVILILLIFTGQILKLMDVYSGPIYNILKMLALV